MIITMLILNLAITYYMHGIKDLNKFDKDHIYLCTDYVMCTLVHHTSYGFLEILFVSIFN